MLNLLMLIYSEHWTEQYAQNWIPWLTRLIGASFDWKIKLSTVNLLIQFWLEVSHCQNVVSPCIKVLLCLSICNNSLAFIDRNAWNIDDNCVLIYDTCLHDNHFSIKLRYSVNHQWQRNENYREKKRRWMNRNEWISKQELKITQKWVRNSSLLVFQYNILKFMCSYMTISHNITVSYYFISSVCTWLGYEPKWKKKPTKESKKSSYHTHTYSNKANMFLFS